MKPLLQLISQGSFFRKVFSIFLKAIAVLVLLAGLVTFFKLWKVIFSLPAAGVLGGILFQLLFAAAIYMVVHILLIRAEDINKLGDSEFTIVPIIAIALKLFGELYASFVSLIAVGGGLLLWFAGYRAGFVLGEVLDFIPFSQYIAGYGGETFVSGLLFIISGLIVAFFTLVFFYLLSELTIVTIDIARNTKVIRETVEKIAVCKKEGAKDSVKKPEVEPEE